MMTKAKFKVPGQVVLVFQGGGALGAYQAGVFEAIEEAGIEPDWVVGTSIGAINARAPWLEASDSLEGIHLHDGPGSSV